MKNPIFKQPSCMSRTSTINLTGISPENFEGAKEYRLKHMPEEIASSIKAIQINYPFHFIANKRLERGKKGDYIVFLPGWDKIGPTIIKPRLFERNYQEKVQQ